MKPIIKKIAYIAAIASLPVFAVADIAVGITLHNTKKCLEREQLAVLAEFRKSDEFNRAYTRSYNNYQVELDEEKITEAKFKQKVEQLDSDKYAKEVLYEFGSEEDIAKFESAGAKVKDFEVKNISYAYNGMATGTALSALAFTAASLVKKKEDEENSNEI